MLFAVAGAAKRPRALGRPLAHWSSDLAMQGKIRLLSGNSNPPSTLRLMHHGATRPQCAWGIAWKEEGIEGLLPQLSAARVLSSFACLRARIRFEEGHPAEALDDLLAAITMSRQVSLDGSLIGVLVGYSIEARMSETIALYLPKLKAETIKVLQKRLQALPAGARPAISLRICEENTLDWLIGKVKQTKDKESLVTFFNWVVIKDEKNISADDSPSKFVESCGGNAEGVIKFIEQTRPSYALMAKAFDLPMEQFDKEYKLEVKKQAGNPVFNILFPAIVKVRQSQARAEVRHAMLATALAIQLEGLDALKSNPDPVVGGPFEHVAVEGGFELRSKFKQDGKPITLSVGQRGK